MPTNSPKFQYPGIVPFSIEYEKTIEDITNQYFQDTKTQYINDKTGNLYPFSLSFQNLVKFYWRFKKLNFSVNLSNTYKHDHNVGGGVTQCVQFFTETITIQNDEGKPSIEFSDALDSLKKRVCEVYDIEYTVKENYVSESGTRENTWDTTLGLYQNTEKIPAIVAKCTGDPSSPDGYIYYPRMDFLFSLYSDTWGAYVAYDNTKESVQNQKTVNIKIEGQTVGTFTMYMVTRKKHSFCELLRNSTEFSDWNIDIWDKPQ